MSSSQANKRTKLTTACDNCRKRKIKCDGVNPHRCNNCSKRKGTVCTYNGTHITRMYEVSYVENMKEELSRCQALLDESASTSKDSLERKNNTDITPSSDYEDISDEHLVDNLDGLYTHTHEERANIKFFGNSPFRGLFARIEAYTGLKTLDFINGKRPQYWLDDWSRAISPHSYFTSLPYTNEDFGDEALLEQLITLYFEKVNVSMPLLNESHFRKQIPNKLNRSFGTILMLVAALGALYLDDNRLSIPGRENLKFLQGYYYYNIAVEKMPNYMKASAELEDIQALILLQMYVQRGVHTKSSSMINGLTILLSQNIGLHSKLMNENHDDIIEKEARKRAWWILYIMDRSNTACFGRNLLIKDDEMHLDHLQVTAEDPSNNTDSIKYINDIIKICEIHGQITHKLYKFSESNPGEDAILEMKDIAMLNTKINDWINDVSITEEDIKNDTTYQLRANIKLAFYNAQLILYRPFMPCPTLKRISNFQTASLAICSNASRSIISIYSDLVLNRKVDRIWADCLISWCPFWATLIMILSFCESKRIGNIRYQDLDYIKTGILTLRSVESENVLYGRAVDILLSIVKTLLPPGDAFIEDQQLISLDTEFYSTVAAHTLQPPQDNVNVVEQDNIFFRDMLDYLRSDSSNSVHGSYNLLISPEHENDLNMMINSILDGDADAV
ncbi:hypothetical protein E3Q04_03645 [Wallemia mellicola]|nr:hypothetical protein E3Q04_03645 [Wallemia mellicola]